MAPVWLLQVFRVNRLVVFLRGLMEVRAIHGKEILPVSIPDVIIIRTVVRLQTIRLGYGYVN